MSNEGGEGVWFRRRRFGYGYSAASWQGAVATVVFVAVLLATVFAGDPASVQPNGLATFLKVKALVGLNAINLPVRILLPLLLGEVGIFLTVVLWTGRPIKPLD